MSTNTHYSDAEWSLIKAAPHWVFAVLSAADGRSGAIAKHKETVAMSTVLEEADGGNVLVRAAVDAGDDKHDIPRKVSEKDALAQLGKINKLLEAKVGREDGEEFRDFLMDVANGVANAAKEGLMAKSKVSDEEKEALQDIAVALQATASYKQRRRNMEQKAEREEKAKATASVRAAAAAKKAASDRTAAESKKRASSNNAHTQRIAAARTRRAAAEKKSAAEAVAKAKQKAAAAAKSKAAQATHMKKMAATAAATQKAAQKARTVVAQAAAEKAKVLAEHTVGGGDSLSMIAVKYYGNGSRANWMAIYEANKELIGKNPGMIFPGQVLKIPNLG